MNNLFKQNKYLFPLFGFLAGVVFCMLIFLSSSSDKKETLSSFFKIPQKVHAINMNKTFDFAGEPVPINPDTYERLDRELTVNAYWQSATLLNLKMSYKYFPIVEKILAQQGIPDDFKYLAVAESGLRNLRSTAGAKGYWQFMKPAAVEMGLEINDDVDERQHIEKSTLAACKYIKSLYKRFGTWTNAAGSYNVGPTSFAKSMTEQGESSFYDLNLNEETSRYIFRIIAIKEILANPTDFGFMIEEEQKYHNIEDLKEVEVTSSISNLAKWAHDNGITYRMLKFYNPWLVSGQLRILPGKSYIIKIPK